ncbi:DUF1217 domain-containing protein [Chthonobacter rhizosphaerae]|uniref:DUF1217 domain-containing protein n=1 Tax=Chthonobacter rhizosphaerae TaxID=2735553 RepID=UPI0015EF90A9|nr:DUF1217 domain-containing protein [Chthonobacter rhizosphaerae]
MVDTSLRYRMILQDIDRQAKRAAAAAAPPPTAAETAARIKADRAYYEAKATSIRTVDDLLADDRMLGIVLKAFDLEHARNAKALLAQVLAEGSRPLGEDKQPIARTLSDRRFLGLAETLDYRTFGPHTLSATSVRTAVLNKYEAAMKAPPAPRRDLPIDRRTEEDPKVRRDTEHYLATIENVRTIEDFLKSGRVFNYAMKAFGLEEMINSKGLIRKVLQSDLSDPNSYARRLRDDRFQKLAAAFDFRGYGENATRLAAVREPVVAAYKRQVMEATVGAENEGVRLALNFRRVIADMSLPLSVPNRTDAEVRHNNIMKFLGEPALIKVVRTALGIPASSASANLEAQVRALASKFNPAELQRDPKKLDAFLQRFATRFDLDQGGGQGLNPAVALFTNQQTAATESLLLSLQTLRLGGR